jgi:hypothetical protein
MRLLKKLEIRDKSRDRFLLNVARLVGSRGDIIPRPSQLDPDVRVSLHPAPDVLKLSFCSCERNRGNFREQLEGCFFSNCYGFHLHDEDVPSLH